MRTTDSRRDAALQGVRVFNPIITFLSETGEEISYDSELINNVTYLFKTKLFRTNCKSIEIDSKMPIPKGTIIHLKVDFFYDFNNLGLPEWGSGWVTYDYGYYKVTDEATYQADTESFIIDAYDKMVDSMIKYENDLTFPAPMSYMFQEISTKFGWEIGYDAISGYNRLNNTYDIPEDLFKGKNLTYRDILDYIAEANGCNIGFNKYEQITCQYPNDRVKAEEEGTTLAISERDLEDQNIDIAKKVGPINAASVAINNEDIEFIQDASSIAENGIAKITFNNNPILMKNPTLLTSLFDEIKGFYYYAIDIDTIGILALEPSDSMKIILTRQGSERIFMPTIIFNDELVFGNGIKETIYNDEGLIETDSTIYVTDDAQKAAMESSFSINSNYYEMTLSAVSVQATTSKVSVGSYTIPEDGIYLITGYGQPNYYGQSGRDLNFNIEKNSQNIAYMPTVINTAAYTVTTRISLMAKCNKGDVIRFIIQSTQPLNWAFNGGKVQFIKLR